MPIYGDVFKLEVYERIAELVLRWSTIDILVVADTIVSLGPEHHPNNLNENFFGMGHLLGVLEGVATVTRAHRSQDPLQAPGVVEGFRFDSHDLSRYDQIWLLGYGTGPELAESEQAAVASFMNAGGGVFATGDHEGLGSGLAGKLPRVRSMRRWSAPPPALGPARIDTTRPDANDVVVFENQSDDIPQVLRLKSYFWAAHRWYREVYPHPVLCSSSGPISEFPDHMHEGEVIIPDTLDATISLPGKRFDEYPRGTDGSRVAPEIIAWCRTTGRASPEVMHDVHTGDPGGADARWTGAVGVYNGHRAGVGRVVVDSTWHHFFDINLIGDNAANRPSVTDPRAAIWRKGFTGSPKGERILAKIDQYFRNIVNWLSPGIGTHLRFTALVGQLALSHEIREVLETADASAAQIGSYAWEYALRWLPPCTTMELLFDPIAELIPFPYLPWDEPTPGPDDGPIPPWPFPPRHLAEAALGGALLAFARTESVDELDDDRASERLRAAALEGVREFVDTELTLARAALDQLERTAEQLRGNR